MDKRMGQASSIEERTHVSARERTAEATRLRGRRSEKGVALVLALILSAVSLALITALIYMVTAGTQISGFQKRYKTSVEASKGGTELFYMLVGLRGDGADSRQFESELDAQGFNADIISTSTCSGTSSGGTPYTGLLAKLLTPGSSWTSDCDKSLSIDPGNPSTYDMKLELGGTNNKYSYYAKIVNTIEGNTGPGGMGSSTEKGLINRGVVSSGVGEIQVMQKPYLYAMEVMATSSTNSSERSKLSILYQY